jgi:hypothetical protein
MGWTANCYFWLDPVKKVTGTVFIQILPFYDERVVSLFGKFERVVYDSLASGSSTKKG